jgi:hypothetical protein
MQAIMELAPPWTGVGRDPWDEARYHFARFHARWLKFCIETGTTERIPSILSAIQGREMAARILDELSGLEEAGELSPAVKEYQKLRMELRKLQARIAGVVGGADGPGPRGGDKRGLMTSGGLRDLTDGIAATGGPTARSIDTALLQKLDAEYRVLHGRLPEVRAAAAAVPGFEALAAPRMDTGTLVAGRADVPGSGLGANEALVLFLDVSEGLPEGGIEGALVMRRDRDLAWVALPGVRALAAEVERVSHRLGDSPRMGESFRYAGQRGDGGTGAVPTAEAVTPFEAEALSEEDLSTFWEDMEERIGEQVWQPLDEALAGAGQVICITQGRLHLLPLDLAAPKDKVLRHYPGLVYYGWRRGLLGRADDRQSRSRSSPTTIGLTGYDGENHTIPFVWGEVAALEHLHKGRGSHVQIGDPYAGSPDGTDFTLLHLACHGVPVDEGMRQRVVLHLGPGRPLDMGRIMESRLKVDQVFIAACLGGTVREDLDGEPSGVVGGYLYRGTTEVAAAVVALPDSWTMLASLLIHQAWLETGNLGEAVIEGKRRFAAEDWYPDTERLFTEFATRALADWQKRILHQRLVYALTYNEEEWHRLVAPLLPTTGDPGRYAVSTLRQGTEGGTAWGEKIKTTAAEVFDQLVALDHPDAVIAGLLHRDPPGRAVAAVLARRIPPQPLLGAIIHGIKTFGEAGRNFAGA